MALDVDGWDLSQLSLQVAFQTAGEIEISSFDH